MYPAGVQVKPNPNSTASECTIILDAHLVVGGWVRGTQPAAVWGRRFFFCPYFILPWVSKTEQLSELRTDPMFARLPASIFSCVKLNFSRGDAPALAS